MSGASPPAALPVRVAIDAARRVNLALQQQGVPFLRSLTLTHDGPEPLLDVAVEVRTDPAFCEPLVVRFDRLEPGATRAVDVSRLAMSASFLARQAERVAGHLGVEVRCAAGATRTTAPVEVLAPTHWTGVGAHPELLAAFVRPNADTLVDVLHGASRRLQQRLGDGALCGYQRRDPAHVEAMVRAIWETVQGAGIRYIDPPASFEDGGQKIRTHEQVLGDSLGTCLDLAVLFAALFEQVGLHPVVVFVRGHAFPGVWLTPFQLPEAVLDDPLPLRKRVELGEALVVDAVPVTTSTPFDQAVALAERHLRATETFAIAIDVAAARKAAAPVLPLPLERSGDALAQALRPTRELTPAVLPSERFRPIEQAEPGPASPPVAGRLDRWQQRLLDLSLRNRFLNHRENKSSLGVPRLDPGALEDALARGSMISLVPRGPATSLPGEPDPAAREARLLEVAREAQSRGVLTVDLAPAELAKQALELYRLARAAIEESGAGVLYLALGFLRWFESSSSTQPRMAPLILIPVELLRPRAEGEAWRLRATDEETRVNVTLVEKLRRDFGIDARLDATPADEAGVDVPEVLRAFRRATLNQPRWEVIEAASVATFSFAKFLMWLDLAAKREQLLANPVVRLLARGRGDDGADLAKLPTDEDVRACPPDRLHTVVDADPSQLRAVLAASAGASFVLQGPPGTGKSQTITNVIAQVLGAGKSVLFVSEKMAALEVVQRRLAAAGLGPFCLELHSDKATRAAVVRQLAAPFQLARAHDAGGWQRLLGELTEASSVLDTHASRLAAPSPFGVPLRAVVADLLGLADAPRVPLPDARATSLEGVRSLERAVDELALACREAAPLLDHPLREVRIPRWTPSVEERAGQALEGLELALRSVRAGMADASSILGLPPPTEIGGARRVAELARVLVEAPADVPRDLLDVGAFGARIEEIRGWAAAGREVSARKAALLTVWKPSLFELDLEDLRRRYDRWSGVFFLIAYFALWSARSALARVAVRALPSQEAVRSALGEAAKARDDARDLERRAERGRSWLGGRYRGDDTDWDDVEATLAWAARFHEARTALASELGSYGPLERASQLASVDAGLLAAGRSRDALVGAPRAYDAWVEARRAVSDALGLDPAALPAGFDDQEARARRWREGLPRTRAWSHLTAVAEGARSAGLGPLVDAAMEGRVPPDALGRALARSLREGWWRARMEADPALASFSGFRHQQAIERFRTLDAEIVGLARSRLVATLAARVPDLHAPGEEMALLRRQLQLQKRHLPPRKLFASMPTVLRRLKPVVLMSPQSVARFLDPALEGYDVVVFDEASQIPPWDAVGAIARGRQAVIVGDSKQLPPTSFFDRAESDDVQPDDESLEELESILDEATASNVPELRLRWHYRSRHESLITFSNRHYYDGTLHTFPSADAGAPGVGLELRPLPPGSYDRGGSRTNRPEAEAVVAELERLLGEPDDRRPTLGVVTFSMAQQRLVEDLVDAMRARRPDLDRFFADSALEPVFVKNLENVQGDERDVMLFSIGYGADRTGRVTMSFGPLNRKGGERRLNVAITRARSRLIVFSSLDPDQIDLNRTSAIGARHLKSFLRFARDGARALDAEALADHVSRFESPFEEQVHAALTGAGYDVHTQVGCGGYRVDLAVVDPSRPGAYLLGIECDGASYHGSRSARERDRLRQAVLEQLGWELERVWSTDWWHDRAGQTQRLLERVAAVRARGPRVRPAPPPAPPPPVAPEVDVVERLTRAPAPAEHPPEATPWPGLPELPPSGTKESFYERASLPALGDALAHVASVAGPVERDQAYRHVARAWGLQSIGKRIVEVLDEALGRVDPARRPRVVDGFLWPPELSPATWRGFHPTSERDRTHAEVSVEELANAASWVLSRALSMGDTALLAETVRVFGWARVTPKVEARLGHAVERLVAEGRALRRGDALRAPDPI